MRGLHAWLSKISAACSAQHMMYRLDDTSAAAAAGTQLMLLRIALDTASRSRLEGVPGAKLLWTEVCIKRHTWWRCIWACARA